jgi:hypothetical protein
MHQLLGLSFAIKNKNKIKNCFFSFLDDGSSRTDSCHFRRQATLGPGNSWMCDHSNDKYPGRHSAVDGRHHPNVKK